MKKYYALTLASSLAGFALPLSPIYAADTSTASASNELEEIVITAQKRTERLSDVPVSASVVSSEALASANVGDISDLNNVVPSVNLVGTFNGRVPMGIRGISSNANEATVGLASGVAIMIDGVPVPSDSQSGNQLEDIKSVEVLKGPQATLGGRTAAAGVINIVTRGPSDHLTGNVSLTGTDDKEYRFNGFVAGPLSDNLQGSVSGYANTREFPVINLSDGKHSKQDNKGVRAKLLIKPNDALDITLMGDYHTSKSSGPNFVYSYVTPGAYLLIGIPNPSSVPPPPPPPILATLSQAAVLTGITPSNTNEYYNSPVKSSADIKDSNFSLNINYTLGDLTLGSTTAYQHETQVNIQDLFVNSSYFSNNFRDGFIALNIPAPPASWPDFFNYQTQNIDVKQTSQEFKLVSPADGRFNYVLGLFFSDQKVSLGMYRTFEPAQTLYDTSADTKTYDIYGRATWNFVGNTSAVLGLRYNSDHLSYDYRQRLTTVSSANSDTSSAVVGDLSFQQKFSSNSMAYLTYARGYAPRVFNTGIYSGGDAVAPTGTLPITDQEHIDHFELGSKGTYLDQHLMLNASLFYTVYSNYQIQTSQSIPGVSAPILFLDTAGKARTQGLEVDATAAATDNLRINASAAYVDAKFVTYNNAPCWGNGVTQTNAMGCYDYNGGRAQDLSGKTMPNSPKFKGTLSINDKVPLGTSNYQLELGGTYSYRSKAQMQPDQNPQTIQGAFGLLNLNVGFAEKSGKYSITTFCNNVTDHFYAADIEDFWSPPWNSNTVVMQPARDAKRYFGVRIEAAF